MNFNYKLFLILLFFACNALYPQININTSYLKYYSEGIPRAVTVQGETAFISFGGILKIFSIENPNNPEEIGSFSTLAPIVDILVNNDRIYILADKLYLLNYGDIIEEVSEYNITGHKLEVKGDKLFVLTPTGLSVLDVSNPTEITLISEIALPSYKYDLSINEEFAYVTTSGSFYKIDISNLTSMAIVYFYDPHDSHRNLRDVKCFNDLVYATVTGELIIFRDIATDSLEIINEIEMHFDINKIFIHQNRLYITDWSNGIYIYDISNPTTPVFLNLYSTSLVSCIAVNNNMAIVLRSYNLYFPQPIEILDLTQSVPSKIYEIDVNGAFADLVAYNDFVYVSYYNRNVIQVIDFGSVKPIGISKIYTQNNVNSLEIENDNLFVSTDNGFEIYSLENQTSPTLVSNIKLGSHVLNIIVVNNLCFLGTDSGVQIFDISDLYNPLLLSTYESGISKQKIAYGNGKLFYLNKSCDFCESTVEILDVTNPASPQLINKIYISLYYMPLWYPHLTVSSSYLFCFSGSLKIFDIRDPYSPFLVSEIRLESTYFDEPHKIYVTNNKAYCVSNHKGIYVVDITDVAAPIITDILGVPGDILSIAPKNDDLLASAKETGVFLINGKTTEVQDYFNKNNSANIILNSYPNPFNSLFTIDYSIPFDSFTRIKIYDILGNTVLNIDESYKNKGEYKIKVDFSKFYSGIYFIMLNVNQKSVTKKIILLK